MREQLQKTGQHQLASVTVEAVLLGPLEARSNLVFGFVHAGPGGTLDRLSGLEILVDSKEMLDLEQHQLAYVGEIPDVVASMDRTPVHTAPCRRHPPRPSSGTSRLPGTDQAARETSARLIITKRIERIAVLAKGSLDEAVVGRILGRGEQRTVQPDPASFMINFVLVLLTLGDLDGDIEGQTAERPLTSLDIGCGHLTSLGLGLTSARVHISDVSRWLSLA